MLHSLSTSQLSANAGSTSTNQIPQSASSNLLPHGCKRYIIIVLDSIRLSKLKVDRFPNISIRCLFPNNDIGRLPPPSASTSVIIAFIDPSLTLEKCHQIPSEWNAEILRLNDHTAVKIMLKELNDREAMREGGGAAGGVESRKRKEMSAGGDGFEDDGSAGRPQKSLPNTPSTSEAVTNDTKRPRGLASIDLTMQDDDKIDDTGSHSTHSSPRIRPEAHSSIIDTKPTLSSPIAGPLPNPPTTSTTSNLTLQMVTEMIQSSEAESRKRERTLQSQIDVLTDKLGVLERAAPVESRITASSGGSLPSDGGGSMIKDEIDEVDAANAARDTEIAFTQLSDGFGAFKKEYSIKIRKLKERVDKIPSGPTSSFTERIHASILALDARVAVSGRLILEVSQQQKARMGEMEYRLQRTENELRACTEELGLEKVRAEATYATRLDLDQLENRRGQQIDVVKMQQSSPPLSTSSDRQSADIESSSMTQRLESFDARLNNLEMTPAAPLSATLALQSTSIISLQQQLASLGSSVTTINRDGSPIPPTVPSRHVNPSSSAKSLFVPKIAHLNSNRVSSERVSKIDNSLQVIQGDITSLSQRIAGLEKGGAAVEVEISTLTSDRLADRSVIEAVVDRSNTHSKAIDSINDSIDSINDSRSI